MGRLGSVSDELDGAESMADVLDGAESMADVLDGAESIGDVLDGAESSPDVLGGAADVCIVLLVVVPVTTPTTLMIETVFGLISSLTYVV